MKLSFDGSQGNPNDLVAEHAIRSHVASLNLADNLEVKAQASNSSPSSSVAPSILSIALGLVRFIFLL
jgi:hypothetical protein